MSEATNGIRKAITASRLWDGAVVYRADGGTWRETLAGCRLAASDEKCRAMEAVARWAAQTNMGVGPYVIEVEADVVESLRPTSLRESIRADGPTVRADLGRAN